MNNEFKKQWKLLCIDLDTNTTSIAKEIGVAPPNLLKKIRNQTIKYVELSEILAAYDYRIEWVKSNKKKNDVDS